MSQEPVPTVVIGVGKAGIEVIHTIDESDGLGWGEEYDEFFDYVAIDSSANEAFNAPDKATQIYLKSPRRFVPADKEIYPYLTDSFSVGEKGAERQRPVGRYKLDNTETPSWDSHRDKISGAIESHLTKFKNSPDTDAQQLNVIHVHSLGGGTGSGSFPLLSMMIDDITDRLENEYGYYIYTAGIGVIPELKTGLNGMTPSGDNRYYANTYAALRDLELLLDADAEDSLPVYLYSKYADLNDELDGSSFNIERLQPQHEIDNSPYRHYYLVGVDEKEILGENTQAGPETYQSMVDNTIMSAIYGLSMFGNELENWFETAEGNTQFGGFSQTQLSVPIDAVEDYCELNERVSDLRRQVGEETEDREKGTLRQELETKKETRDSLQQLVDNPALALEDFSDSETVRADIKEQIERNIPGGQSVVETTSADIDTIVDYVISSYEDTLIPFAMEMAEDRVASEGEGIEDAWREVVTSKYKELEVASEDGYGHNVTTTAEKAGELRRFINEKIEDLEEQKEADEEEDGGLIDLGWFDSDPDYEAWLDSYESHKEELDEYQNDYDRLKTLKRTIRQRGDEVVDETLKPRIESLSEEITELDREIREKEDLLEETLGDREDKVDELTDNEYGERVGILALDEQKVREDLDTETLENELTSLSAFVGDYFDERDLINAMQTQVKKSYAWDSTLMTFQRDPDAGIGERPTAVRDIWMLHSEENSDLPDFEIQEAGSHDFRRSGTGDQQYFPRFEDPYTVQFISYCLDWPVSDIKIYAELEKAAEEGWLDSLIDAWHDYRLAFAYPEWYGRDVQKVFEIEASEEVPKLPELEIEKVNVDKEGGELKNWVSSHGLASYLWQADEWNDYEGNITVRGSDSVGWKTVLREYDLEYSDMRDITPSGRTTKLWMAGEITWDELLEEVRENIIKKAKVEVKFKEDE